MLAVSSTLTFAILECRIGGDTTCPMEDNMENTTEKPVFNGNLFEYEGGMMYFPDGIDAWCRKHDVEIVEMRDAGDVWCLRTGKAQWEEYPFDVAKSVVFAIKG